MVIELAQNNGDSRLVMRIFLRDGVAIAEAMCAKLDRPFATGIPRA